MQVKRYEWSENFRGNADPAEAGKAIERLGQRIGRDVEGISPSDLVSEARNPESPLHSLFTWDDAEAASKRREDEARYVLRSIRIVVVDERGEEHKMIGRVAVRTSTESNQRLYVPMTLAAHRESLRTQMIDDAIAGLNGWRNRYEHLQGAKSALDHIDRAVALLKKSKLKKNVDRPTLTPAV